MQLNEFTIIASGGIWLFAGLYVINEYLDIEDKFAMLAQKHEFFGPLAYVLALFLWPLVLIVSYRFDDGYKVLFMGEVICEGDEAYTWADPECTTIGWVPLYGYMIGKEIDAGHVLVRRKKVR